MDKQLEKTDLTVGPITRKLVLFALPILAGNIIQQLYNVADSVIVARFEGPGAMAAVVVGGPTMMLFNALFMGLSMGGNILISQYRGAKQFDTLEKAVNTVLTCSFIMGTLVTLLGIFFSRGMLVMLGTPEDILESAASYLRIVFIGMNGSILYNFSNGMTRGFGDSKTPLYVLTGSCILNICLDLVFVALLGWGVEGAAIATAIANLLSGAFLMWRFAGGRYGVKISLSRMKKIDLQTVKLMFKLGIPSSIQSTIMSFGNLFLQSFSNTFGSQFIAANGIVMQIDGFAMMPMFGMSMAVTTFTGQNIGAGYVERSKKGIVKGVQISVCIAIIMGFMIYNFGSNLIHAYTSDPTVVAIGSNAMRFLAFFFSFMGINQCLSGAMRGAGAAAVPAALTVVSNLIRIPVAYFLAMVPNNYMGMFYSMGVNMTLGSVMNFIYYRFGKWHTKGVTGRGPGGGPPGSPFEDNKDDSGEDDTEEGIPDTV